MKKIIIIQPTETIEWDGFHNFVKFIEDRKDNDVLVLNKNMTYEVVEIGE